MFLETLKIEGYKNFDEPFEVQFEKGLNVIVGENGSGKSAIVDALRLILMEDEPGRVGIRDTDFHRPFTAGAEPAKSFRIITEFSDLSRIEQVAFLPWTTVEGKAKLTLIVDSEEMRHDRYKRVLWGGESRASMFESELFNKVNCIYLPPLRDAESRLREGRGSHLARLLRNMNKIQLIETRKRRTRHPLEVAVQEFNKKLADDETQTISAANKLISEQLKEVLGDIFGQDTWMQFSEVNFNRIVEGLRLLFFPEVGASGKRDLFRSLQENSLGFNNILYIATILAELVRSADEYLRILLIEEPEAHLHPQLKIRLLKFLEGQARKAGMQVIVTTHSPVLASAATLDSIIHLSNNPSGRTFSAPLRNCGLSANSKAFVSRWLDVTKSILLFAKGVILVEGIAEALLIPELAKIVLSEYKIRLETENKTVASGVEKNKEMKGIDKKGERPTRLPASLEDGGVSVINMNGIYFKHFLQLFCNLEGGNFMSIPVRCAGITDQDPPKDAKDKTGKEVPFKPTLSQIKAGRNPALKLIDIVKKSDQTRLYTNKLKTFEYDLAMEAGNLNVMLATAKGMIQTDGPIKRQMEKYTETNWGVEKDELKRADAADYLLKLIVQIDKGEFAQALATKLEGERNSEFAVPGYIRKAIIWACGGPDE